MPDKQLGPFADVETFIVGDGYTAINHLLAQGYRILNVSFVLDERGRGTPDYRKQYLPYAAMGRAIAEGETADAVRAEAIAYSQAQQDVTDNPLRNVPDFALTDDEPPPPFEKPAGPPNTPVRRAPRRPSVAIGADHP